MYIYISHTHMYSHKYTYVNKRIYIHICMQIHICKQIYTYIYIYVAYVGLFGASGAGLEEALQGALFWWFASDSRKDSSFHTTLGYLHYEPALHPGLAAVKNCGLRYLKLRGTNLPVWPF